MSGVSRSVTPVDSTSTTGSTRLRVTPTTRVPRAIFRPSGSAAGMTSFAGKSKVIMFVPAGFTLEILFGGCNWSAPRVAPVEYDTCAILKAVRSQRVTFKAGACRRSDLSSGNTVAEPSFTVIMDRIRDAGAAVSGGGGPAGLPWESRHPSSIYA
jgi:hypothetical protein